jgi:WD40 repeat protein
MWLPKLSKMMCPCVAIIFMVIGCTPVSTPEANSQPSPTLLVQTTPTVQNTAEPIVKFILEQPASDFSGGVEGLAFSPDGRILAALYKTGKIILWDVNSRQLIQSLMSAGETGGFGMMPGFAFSPDGRSLVTKANGLSPVLLDIGTGQSIEVESGLSHGNGMALSPDGKLLAYGKCEKLTSGSHCSEYAIIVWDMDTRQPVGQPISFPVGASAPLGLLFSPDGKTLAVMSSGTTGSGKIGLFNVDTRQLIAFPLEGKAQFTSMAFSPDGNLLSLGAIGGVIYLWDMQTHEVASKLKGESGVVTSLMFSPDGKTLASRILIPSTEQTPHEKLVLWDTDTLQTIGEPLTGQSAKGSDVGLISMDFSPDSMTLTTGTEDGVIIVWNLATKGSKTP